MHTPNASALFPEPPRDPVFVTGGTGYIGRRLIAALLQSGYPVRALARPASLDRLPAGCTPVPGNALDAATFMEEIAPARTLVHLVGVSHPAPWKADQFHRVDYASVQASVEAARWAGIEHFVYVSVAQPAPVMKAYVRVRAACEQLIREHLPAATFLRPWYVLGPGHRWPVLLRPLYRAWESIPATSATARRLGLVHLDEMVAALEWAVAHPARGMRALEVPQIRSLSGRPHTKRAAPGRGLPVVLGAAPGRPAGSEQLLRL